MYVCFEKSEDDVPSKWFKYKPTKFYKDKNEHLS